MRWLLEPEVFQEDEYPLMEALDNLGVKYTACQFGTPYDKYIKDTVEPTIFHGSLQFGKQIQQQSQTIRVYCNLPQYECLYYYPRLGKYLLNDDYVMLPLGDLERQKSMLFSMFGYHSPGVVYNKALFIRPSSGYKTFTGTLIKEDNWRFNVYPYKALNPEALVVVSSQKEIFAEWRVVVIDKQAVTAGQYSEKGKIVRISNVPERVMKYAQLVLNHTDYEPDRAWVLDICESSRGELWVVEPNSFSCAGLYACDYEAIVKTMETLDD